MGAALLFVAGTRLTDRLIRRVEQIDHLPDAPTPLATHVALLFDGAWGVQAVWPRVARYDRDDYAGAVTRSYPLPLSPQQETGLQQAALATLGEWYDLLGVVKAGLYVLTGRPERFWEDDRARVQCAAEAVVTLRAVGLSVLPALPPSNVTPARLECWAPRVA